MIVNELIAIFTAMMITVVIGLMLAISDFKVAIEKKNKGVIK